MTNKEKLFNHLPIPANQTQTLADWQSRPFSSSYMQQGWQEFDGRWIGIDWGKANIGVALSDPSRTIANGFGVIANTRQKNVFAQFDDIISQYDISLIVVGMPLNMDGSFGTRAQISWQMAWNWFKSRRTTPMIMWDERLSSKGVERMLINEGDITRSRRKQLIDKLSAAWILQGALDYCAMLAQNNHDTNQSS